MCYIFTPNAIDKAMCLRCCIPDMVKVVKIVMICRSYSPSFLKVCVNVLVSAALRFPIVFRVYLFFTQQFDVFINTMCSIQTLTKVINSLHLQHSNDNRLFFSPFFHFFPVVNFSSILHLLTKEPAGFLRI